MLAEVINRQSFCKAIYKHISIANLFDYKFAFDDQFSDIIILNIDVFGFSLIFGIFGANDAGFIISI